MNLGTGTPALWGTFFLIVVALLALDLGVVNRKSREISTRAAMGWTAFYVGCALAFNVFIWLHLGHVKGLEFLTGYLIEESLSVDNLFVMVLVFTSFGVPKAYQHRVLFWGIIGAQVMRGVLIVVGAQLVARFHFIIYVFGAFLVFTGVKMLLSGDEAPDPQKNRVLKLFRRFVPSTENYDGHRFTTKIEGRRLATPLMATLVVIEAMDLVFAVDSIPAIFAITTDPFIVFTSNIFAIMGLRSIYFVLANVIEKFVHLKIGLAVILSYVGVKMLVSGFFHIPVYVSLAVITGVLAASIVSSLLVTRRREALAGRHKELVERGATSGARGGEKEPAHHRRLDT